MAVFSSNEDLWLNADPTRLAQVLQNLLGNAAKFTPSGGRITLKAYVKGDRLHVNVLDNGAGITAASLENSFELFSQVDEVAVSRQSGLGIGLSLTRSSRCMAARSGRRARGQARAACLVLNSWALGEDAQHKWQQRL